jgi:toxin ParE1/3/4
MKILPVHWSDAAERDVNDLADHIAQVTGSFDIAVAYSRRIQARCDKIRLVPLGGTLRDKLLPGLRSIPFERSALILYRIADDGAWITNIFRRGRDIEALFEQD